MIPTVETQPASRVMLSQGSSLLAISAFYWCAGDSARDDNPAAWFLSSNGTE